MFPMTLGQVIDVLKRKNRGANVVYDFDYFGPTELDSYRGYYEDLALGYGNRFGEAGEMKVGALLEMCEGAIGKVYTGWKGGKYTMDESTRMWAANRGECPGVAIVDVEQLGPSQVVLRTELVE